MAIKSFKGVTIGKGTPQKLEGQNGDITIRSTNKGTKMYVKEANKWHSIDLDVDLKQIALSVQKLKDQIKKLTTKRNNSPVVDKLLLKQSGGAAAVGIQNKSGKIAFRNAADSADAELINPKISGTISTDTNPILSTAVSNTVQVGYNDVSSTFQLRIIGPPNANLDTLLSFFVGAAAKWSMGFDSSSDTTFRINAGANLDADVLQLTSAGALTVDSTVTSSNGICSGTGALDTGSSAITTTGVISGGSFNHFMDTQIHNYNSTLTALHYIPFGGSQTDSTSIVDTMNDQTLYIAPYDGYVVKLILQSATGLATDAGATKFYIRVNGALSTRVTVVIADETSHTVSFGGSDSTFGFDAGDRIRIGVDPVAAMKDVTATSVWRYTI